MPLDREVFPAPKSPFNITTSPMSSIEANASPNALISVDVSHTFTKDDGGDDDEDGTVEKRL